MAVVDSWGEHQMKVTKLAICDMWSYAGPDRTVLSDLGQVNVIIGKNNAGKSNLVKTLKWAQDVALLPDTTKQQYQFVPNWEHNSGQSGRNKAPYIQCSFRIGIDDWPTEKLPTWMQRLQTFSDEGRLTVLFTLSLSGESAPYQVVEDFAWEDRSGANRLLSANNSNLNEAEEMLTPLAREVIADKVVVLDGWRQLSDHVLAEANYVTCIDRLRRSPDAAQRGADLYQSIRRFFQLLTGIQTIEIYPRDSEADFNITIDGRTLPLSQYGDGIRHLLMVAIKAAMKPGGVFIVEEPETHLHPHFQRHLLWFLTDQLRSQVFITTHSPVFLDARRADRIMRITNDRSSRIEVVEAPKECYEVLDDIGARPSDILQANVVIWVEGPSDRILLRHALGLVDSGLHEGLHFQIVCYGGALRKYCGFGDDSEGLVNLMRLGRHVAMVCDRDGDSAATAINEQKERLKEECERAKGFYWVTEGREIENYLSDSVLSRAFKSILSADVLTRNTVGTGVDISIKLSESKRLDAALKALGRRLKITRCKWLKYSKHKPEIMSAIVRSITEQQDLDRLDFLNRLDGLATFIRKHNTLHANTTGHP